MASNVAFVLRGVVSRKLILFLKKQGLSNGAVSRRYSVTKSPHVIGEELNTPQISEDVAPCPESLHEDHGGTLEDVIENFLHRPESEREVVPLPATKQRGRCDAMKLKAVSRVSVAGPSGSLPPHILYLLEIGFDLEQIKAMARNDPSFAYYSLEGKVRPLVEFLLDLGVSKSNLPSIVVKNPRLCGLSLSRNVIPKMEFLETLGVDKKKWGKFLTRCPDILSRSIEDQLRPKAEYFRSLGVDVTIVLRRCPQIMGLSLEANLKAVTKFFLENGFSTEEVGIMISNYPYLYAISLKGNLVPKWEFFLSMDYSRGDLLKYPIYFGYSLERRIKPRFSMMKEFGVKLSLRNLLILNHDRLEMLLQKMAEK